MRDPNRIPRIMNKLQEVWKKVPDWRFFQLITNMYNSTKYDPFFVQDDETERMIDTFIQRTFVVKENNNERQS